LIISNTAYKHNTLMVSRHRPQAHTLQILQNVIFIPGGPRCETTVFLCDLLHAYTQ